MYFRSLEKKKDISAPKENCFDREGKKRTSGKEGGSLTVGGKKSRPPLHERRTSPRRFKIEK